MDGNGEVSPLGLLLATVVQTDLGVGHTTVVARLGVGLVLLVSVATSGSARMPKAAKSATQILSPQRNGLPCLRSSESLSAIIIMPS